MQITINAETQNIPEKSTVAELIDRLKLQDKRLAIEINKDLVPRSTFASHEILENDEIEIVQAIGGG